LEAILTAPQDEPVTRAGYAVSAGVSPATVTRAARILIEAGLVRDLHEVAREGRGRPERALGIDPAYQLIGVAVDDAPKYPGTLAPDGRIHSSASRAWAVSVPLDGGIPASPEELGIDSQEPADLVEIVATVINAQRKAQKIGSLGGIGVLVGGHVCDGIIRYSPNLGGRAEFDFAAQLRDALELDCDIPLRIDNDANALARQYMWKQSGKPNFALILLKDDGIGAALVSDGRLRPGATGAAGEIGHLPAATGNEALVCRCGNRGCLETAATLHAVGRRLGISAPSPSAMVGEILHRMNNRNTAVKGPLDDVAEHLGRAFATLVNLQDPGALVVLLREELRSYPGFTDRILDEARRHTLPSLRQVLDAATFDALPSPDELAAAAAIQLVDHILDMSPALG
jgi:predicted NBD/HSP70 family sugar kinase